MHTLHKSEPLEKDPDVPVDRTVSPKSQSILLSTSHAQLKEKASNWTFKYEWLISCIKKQSDPYFCS